LLPTAQIAFPQQGTPAQMFRWGNDGFAIQFTEPSDINFANNRLILFRGTPARMAATSLVPAISGLVPASTAATGLNFLLTINGSNFVPGAFVQWDGLQRSTTFVSATQLIAKIPGTDIQGAGSAQITVVNPGPVTSVASAFTITAGTAPFVALSALGLNFGNQQVGATSAPQSVTLKNAGNASLNVSAIAITSPFTTSSYKQTNNCPVSLGGGASCQISVTFSPAGTGAPFESLTITDSATGSPHQVGLVGTGIDFFVSPFRGGSTVTVNSGETATYSVSASASPGFSGVISFACSGAPTGAACTVNPTAVSLGIAPVNFTVTVTTSPRAALTGAPTVFLAGAGWLMLLALAPLLFCFFRWSWFMGLRRRRVFALGVLASMLVLGVVACGGGGGGGSAGTPAGTYTIVLNSTSGAVTHQTQLTLIVR
jgi:hypothetical protein